MDSDPDLQEHPSIPSSVSLLISLRVLVVESARDFLIDCERQISLRFPSSPAQAPLEGLEQNSVPFRESYPCSLEQRVVPS